MKNTANKAAVGFIFTTLLIDITGWGIILPVVPKLVSELIHGDLTEAATYGGWLGFAYAFTQFIGAPIVGNLSDKYGRRPVLLISLLGFGLDHLLLALAPSIGWLFVGRILAGLTGHYGTRIPFYVASALCLLNFLYGYFMLPESLDRNKRRPFDWRRANPVGSLKLLAKHPEISSLAVALILVYIGLHAVQSNWHFFTIYKFDWSERTVGLSLGVLGLLLGLVQGVLIRWTAPKLGEQKKYLLWPYLLCAGFIVVFFCSRRLVDAAVSYSLFIGRYLWAFTSVDDQQKYPPEPTG